MAKDRKPDTGRTGGGASRAGSGAGRGGSGARPASASRPARGTGGRGRTRPPTQVVTQQRPWGLIAAALAVVVFAAAAITYAVLQVREADEARIDSIDEIPGIESYEYAAGQEHVTTPVDYSETPPVGGPHEPAPGWADCTGTVYDVDIRHENAVHSLEHGAVWITYDPEALSDDEVGTLAALVEGQSGRMMSPYAGLDSPVSIQSWNHQLKVDSADDPRIAQFADFLTLNAEFYPEVGASCENPDFIANPRLATEEPAPAPAEDPAAAPATGSGAAPTA